MQKNLILEKNIMAFRIELPPFVIEQLFLKNDILVQLEVAEMENGGAGVEISIIGRDGISEVVPLTLEAKDPYQSER